MEVVPIQFLKFLTFVWEVPEGVGPPGPFLGSNLVIIKNGNTQNFTSIGELGRKVFPYDYTNFEPLYGRYQKDRGQRVHSSVLFELSTKIATHEIVR